MIKLKIIATVLLISMLIFSGIGCLDTPIFENNDKTLSVAVDGIEVKEPSLSLMVFGAAENINYVNSQDAFIASPNQDIIISVAAYNPYSSFAAADYKTSIYTESDILYTSSIVRLEPDQEQTWYYTYTAPSSGRVSIYVESAVRTNEYDIWWFDDMETFDILVVDPTETATETATGTATGTETATGTAIPTNIPPIPSVTKTVSGNVYSYDASASTDPDGTIVSYSWTVDDVVAGTGQTFELDGSTFSAGTHTTKLIITDNSGAASTYTHTITVSIEDETVIIESVDEITTEGDKEESPLTTEQGDAIFVMNIGGQPFYIPGFSAIFAIAGLLAVTYLFYRKRDD